MDSATYTQRHRTYDDMAYGFTHRSLFGKICETDIPAQSDLPLSSRLAATKHQVHGECPFDAHRCSTVQYCTKGTAEWRPSPAGVVFRGCWRAYRSYVEHPRRCPSACSAPLVTEQSIYSTFVQPQGYCMYLLRVSSQDIRKGWVRYTSQN